LGTCSQRTYLFLRPHVLLEVVHQDQLRVVRVPEEVLARDVAELVVEEFVGVAIRELNDRVLQTTDAFEHCVRSLRV